MTKICALLQDDPKLQAFSELLNNTPKQELAVRSWIGVYEGETVHGPHFRARIRNDGSLILRTAWERDEYDIVIHHDYLVTAENASGLKESIKELSF